VLSKLGGLLVTALRYPCQVRNTIDYFGDLPELSRPTCTRWPSTSSTTRPANTPVVVARALAGGIAPASWRRRTRTLKKESDGKEMLRQPSRESKCVKRQPRGSHDSTSRTMKAAA
jgi:hypothetical protein